MKSPSSFYVNNKFYERRPDYGDFCISQINELNDLNPQSLYSAVELLRENIEKYYNSDNSYYGQYRSITLSRRAVTTSDNYQFDLIKRTLHRVYGNNATSEPIVISQVLPVDPKSTIPSERVILTGTIPPSVKEGRFLLQHFYSPGEEETYHAEQLWSEASTRFAEAKSGVSGSRELSIGDREMKAKEFYWFFAHYMPFKRGSATAARILLEYLAETIGFETGTMKNDTDINIDALVRDRDSFVAGFDQLFNGKEKQGTDVIIT